MACVLGAPKGMQTLSVNAWGQAVADQSGNVFRRDPCSPDSHINYHSVRISISAGFVPSCVFFHMPSDGLFTLKLQSASTETECLPGARRRRCGNESGAASSTGSSWPSAHRQVKKGDLAA